jgi:hypothetical protein
MNEENVKRFESIVSTIKRSGINKLVEYCKGSDFLTAPASTRFHSCHEGGLLEHSLNVYDCLCAKRNNPIWKEKLDELGDESIAIVALFHDICKTNFYTVEYKNKKVYSDSGKRTDSNGRYDWETVPGYTVEDKFPYGHGEKSVMMIEQFIKLKPVERYMIRWHMLFTEPKEFYNAIGNAIELYPTILAISEADLESTYLLEEKE